MRFDYVPEPVPFIAGANEDVLRVLEYFQREMQRISDILTNTDKEFMKVAYVSADHTAGEETLILVDASSAAVTITLPSGEDDLEYHIKKVDSSSNAVTIDGDGSETIDGLTTRELTTQWAALSIIYTSGSWYIF